MKSGLTIFGVCFLCLLLSASAVGAQEIEGESRYRFVYAVEAAFERVDLYLVDPLSSDPAQVISIPLDGTRFEDIDPSPDGRFAILLLDDAFYNNYQPKLVLVDMTTGAYNTIVQAADSTLEPRYLSMKWSPDSRSYAFTYIPPDTNSNKQALAVYSLETQALTPLFTFSWSSTDLAWSEDSQKLAFMLYEIGSSNSATIFDIVDSSKTFSAGFYLPDVGASRKLCQTALSPDARYLAFQGGCVEDLAMLPTEIYFWDTTYNPERGQVIQQLTHNAPYSLTADDGALYPFVSYNPIWIDNEHLLVGMARSIYRYDVGIFEDTYHQETRLYNVATGDSRLISTDNLAQWTHNPAKDVWAYQRFPTATSFVTLEKEQPDRSVASQGQRWPDSAPSSVEISTFDGQSFTPLMIAPAASIYRDSKLYWSPDGRFLAYEGEWQGTDAPVHLILVDSTTTDVRDLVITPNHGATYIGGWVVAPIDQNPDRG